jgi:hypothetical protein
VIHADRVMVNGSLLICADAHVPQACDIAGVVSMNGATIQGNLKMNGATVHGAPYSDGDLRLRNGFEARSEIPINKAKIARNVDCSDVVLENSRGYTLSDAGAQISGTLYLGSNDPRRPQGQPRFTSRGTLRLDGASPAENRSPLRLADVPKRQHVGAQHAGDVAAPQKRLHELTE